MELRPYICDLIVSRFPVILVDEYQDTNYFLARAFSLLLARPHVRGPAVGDPDQAIFEFGGAHPALFDELGNLPGANSFRIEQSHRCPENIMRIARMLSVSGQPIRSRGDGGSAILLVHGAEHHEVPPGLPELTRELVGNRRVVILARRHATLRVLQGGGDEVECPIRSRAASQLDRALRIMPINITGSTQLAMTELCRLGFGAPNPSRDQLHAAGLTRRDLRAAGFRLLVNLSTQPEGETWREWLQRVRAVCLAGAARLGLTHEAQPRVGQSFRAQGQIDVVREAARPGAAPLAWPADLIPFMV